MPSKRSRAPRSQRAAPSPTNAPSSFSVEYPSGAFPSHAIDGRRSEHYAISDIPSFAPVVPQFAPGTSAETIQVIREGSPRVLRLLITDAPLVRDTSSTPPLKKPDYLFGDSVDDPNTTLIESERWLHKDEIGPLYLPPIPRHRSLVELRNQAVPREMSWRLTEERDSIHCGYITHRATPGSDRNRVIGLRPGVLGLDVPPRGDTFTAAHTVRNRLARLG